MPLLKTFTLKPQPQIPNPNAHTITGELLELGVPLLKNLLHLLIVLEILDRRTE